jgi:hypothetical protein
MVSDIRVSRWGGLFTLNGGRMVHPTRFERVTFAFGGHRSKEMLAAANSFTVAAKSVGEKLETTWTEIGK